MKKSEANSIKDIERMLPEAITTLAGKYEPIRSEREIRKDLKKLSNAVEHSTATSVYRTLAYLNAMQCDGWLDDIDIRVVAIGLYLMLTTWNYPMQKKYKGLDCTERMNFIREKFDY